jgi:hypothetical protein
VIITKRRVISAEEATAKLDALARRHGITNPFYDESEADSMPEFDALKWTSLCSQRVALQQRENETASSGSVIPSRLLGIYRTKHGITAMSLEDTIDGLNKLAA